METQIIGVFFSLLLPILILFLVMLVIREIALWYWKVNLIITNQQETNDLLAQQNELLEQNNAILKQFVDDFMNK